MPKVTQPPPVRSVGVIGAGQLARMMAESASELGVELVVLATSPLDSAVATATRAVHGEPGDERAVRELARTTDVLTLDHELVDLDLLATLESEGVVIHPSPRATAFAARKDHQRRSLADHGVPVPRFVVLEQWDDDEYDRFASTLATPPVVKAARGGYDGRGVEITSEPTRARDVAREFATRGTVVLEERLDLLGEVAVVLVTAPSGERRRWPVVRTVQRDGLCSEVLMPSGLDASREAEAITVAEAVADVVGAIGVLAVELFVTAAGILVNEVATRPHNSGHWSIEGSTTSQFENHLRAVLSLPLGDTDPVAPAVVMVNVVGSHEPGDVAAALAVAGAHVHDYGKAWRPGRKLGHVTALGDDLADARVRAWAGAEALGTALT